MKQLIYIMGGGRSGSTLLDIVLGNGVDVTGCGELRRFVDLCGEVKYRDPDSACHKFWTKFKTRLQESYSLDFQELGKLTRQVEYHTVFLQPWRALKGGRRMQAYTRYTRAFFDVLSTMTGSEILIDSSKYPGRVLALRQSLDVPVRVIYLIRHPVGVVRSFAKKDIMQPSKGYLAANAYYFVNSALCEATYFRIPRQDRLRVRYRDFVRNPAPTLETIQQKFQIDLSRALKRIESEQDLDTGCLYDGNRLRLLPSVQIKTDEANYGWHPSDVLTRVMNRIWY